MSEQIMDGRDARRTGLRELMEGRELMEARDVGAVLLRRPENFAWYAGRWQRQGGARLAGGRAVVLVTAEGERIVASTIEAPRMRAEVAPELEVIEYPWHDGPEATVGEIVGDAALGADVRLPSALTGLPAGAPIPRAAAEV